jgi:hypothetical protein
MQRYAFIAVMFITVLVPGVPAGAVTAKGKMETCKFGADDQKLTGAARTAFMTKCMANRNDPRGPGPGGAPPPTPPKQ